MKRQVSGFIFGVIFSLMAISGALQAEVNLHYGFSTGNDGWVGDFADYPKGSEAFYELQWGWASLPKSFLQNEKGMVISGNNHSDDLLMFFKKEVTGLQPNTVYEATLTVTVETNIAEHQFGIGGSPGESVFFKVGASTEEPVKVLDGQNYRVNIDVGNQATGGANAMVVGDLSNPLVDAQKRAFAEKVMRNEQPIQVQSDNEGRLWLFVGTDSGFEGTSLYYIANVSVELISE